MYKTPSQQGFLSKRQIQHMNQIQAQKISVDSAHVQSMGSDHRKSLQHLQIYTDKPVGRMVGVQPMSSKISLQSDERNTIGSAVSSGLNRATHNSGGMSMKRPGSNLRNERSKPKQYRNSIYPTTVNEQQYRSY